MDRYRAISQNIQEAMFFQQPNIINNSFCTQLQVGLLLTKRAIIYFNVSVDTNVFWPLKVTIRIYDIAPSV